MWTSLSSLNTISIVHVANTQIVHYEYLLPILLVVVWPCAFGLPLARNTVQNDINQAHQELDTNQAEELGPMLYLQSIHSDTLRDHTDNGLYDGEFVHTGQGQKRVELGDRDTDGRPVTQQPGELPSAVNGAEGVELSQDVTTTSKVDSASTTSTEDLYSYMDLHPGGVTYPPITTVVYDVNLELTGQSELIKSTMIHQGKPVN